MTALEGDRPLPPSRPTNPSDGPGKRFSDLSAADQLRVVEILKPGFQRVLARRRERQRLEAVEHVKAA